MRQPEERLLFAIVAVSPGGRQRSESKKFDGEIEKVDKDGLEIVDAGEAHTSGA
jgi:hypothetical protein